MIEDDVTALVRLVDAGGKTIYSRTYNGEKKVSDIGFGRMPNLQSASDDMVIKIIADEEFLRTLRLGTQ